MVRFSSRLPLDLRPNRLAHAREQVGLPRYDLTNTNPTTCGIPYPGDILSGLADAAALVYRPDPLGPAAARRAVAEEYRSLGIEVEPDRIVLTASTSEAYGLLLRLLTDPGDSMLAPIPSYPLFDIIGRLDSVAVVQYPLDPGAGWRLAPGALIDPPRRCRMVVAVHPNNPTGSLVHREDADTMVSLCSDRGMALVVDEVFLPYPLASGPAPTPGFASSEGCLCFTLGGLSKWIGMPQLKLGWIVVGGPETIRSEALERLSHIADAYLSVNTPVALAAPRLLREGRTIRQAISDRCRHNLETLTELAGSVPSICADAPQGGWSAVLRFPDVIDEESLCVRLLSEHGVAVHPGFFFDFPGGSWLVLSLLPPVDEFREGVRLILETIDELTSP